MTTTFTRPGRLRFAMAGHVLRLMTYLPARIRRKMMREPVDAALPPLADMLRLVQVCDLSIHFGWAAMPDAIVEDFPHLASVAVTHITDGPVPMRLYRNPALPPRCALVWVHGGGFVAGGLDCAEANWVARELASRGIVVLTMAYRKALHGVHFPAPSDDVLSAWHWAMANAARLGVDPAQIHLGGGSAGGNLSAGVAKRVRDDGTHAPASLVLVYPLLHSTLPALAPADEAYCRQHVKAFGSPEFVYDTCLNYTGDAAMLDDPYATPGVGALDDMPPVFIVNAQFDSLRASGDAFAAQVVAEGGVAVCATELGAPHGYLMMPGTPFAHSTVARMEAWLLTQQGDTP